MATLKEVGERNLIKNIVGFIRKYPGIGPGDDAAIVDNKDDKVVVSTDVVTKERHFPKGMTYEHYGWTAAAVSFSDIAAMGARPTGITVAIAFPEDSDENDLYDAMSGVDQCAEFCDTWIVGGDTKTGHGSIVTTAIGSLDGRKPLTRDGARKGDMVAVTGSLGSAAAGFYALENDLEYPESVFSLMVPTPRTAEGVLLSKSGAVTSCMDLSDGLAVAARTICEKSGVGMEIHEEFIPVGEDVDDVANALKMDRRDLVLYWGGDYELMFTFRREMIDRLHKTGLQFSIIGLITDDDGPYIVRDDKRTRIEDGCY